MRGRAAVGVVEAIGTSGTRGGEVDVDDSSGVERDEDVVERKGVRWFRAGVGGGDCGVCSGCGTRRDCDGQAEDEEKKDADEAHCGGTGGFGDEDYPDDDGFAVKNFQTGGDIKRELRKVQH